MSAIYPILLLFVVSVAGQNTSNSQNSTSSSQDGETVSFGTLFSSLTTTNIALLVVVCVIIATIFAYLLRQAASSRARIEEIRASEIHYAIHHFDKQSLAIPPL